MNLESFFFDIPLYTKISIDETNYNEFECMIYSQGKRDVDGYNPVSKVQTTFEIIKQFGYSVNDFPNNGGFAEINIRCKRYGDVLRYYCVYDPNKKVLMKIGQYPSVAEIHLHEIKEYKKLLPNEKLKEFTRAIGLAANGVGIGSFVYLRRIFEYLIEEAHIKAKKISGWDETVYQRSRMGDKIEILKNELPDFLVEHKEMYGILSKGVHELEEQECLLHFLPIKTGIEMILDDKVIEFEKIEKRAKASSAIKEIASKINQQKK